MAKTTRMKQRSVTTADRSLGERIRARRIAAAITQQELAEKLGVSFQQVQKYEKGKNRVSVVRLGQIAKALDESISYFQSDDSKVSKAGLEMQALITDPVNLRACRALAALTDQSMRYQFVRLLEQISGIAEAA
jgi:transcriptional regulator with XRE-family HTH domain